MADDNGFATVVNLHKEDDQDEPLELDVDVSVTCDCGTTSTKREQVYKEHDTASVMCDACGAVYQVEIRTLVSFVTGTTIEEESCLSVDDRAGIAAARRFMAKGAS